MNEDEATQNHSLMQVNKKVQNTLEGGLEKVHDGKFILLKKKLH